MQALMEAQEGRADDALATARRIIIAGRSLGDEPCMIAQLVRVAIRAIAVQVIERALAQGRPSTDGLARTQRLLEEDAAEPLMLYALRGERALLHRLVEGLKSGDAMAGGAPPGLRERVSRVRLSHMARGYHPVMLRTFSRAVEIACFPPEEQAEQLRRLEEDTEQQAMGTRGPGEELTGMLMPALGKLGAIFRRDQAILRGTILALALERYRLDTGHWPKDLQELVPAHVSAVPSDPFDGREMRYKALADGVIVYSVGPDGQDDGGALNRKNIIAPGTDLGFRLWDVAARRQPAAEALPLPDESD
jgi:hypothetical protein